jgi:hypothetical protein
MSKAKMDVDLCSRMLFSLVLVAELRKRTKASGGELKTCWRCQDGLGSKPLMESLNRNFDLAHPAMIGRVRNCGRDGAWTDYMKVDFVMYVRFERMN